MCPPGPRSPRPGAGFTLQELMVVLVLLGVVGTLAIGSFGRPNRATIAGGAAREIHAKLTQARFAAISGGAQVRVTLLIGETDPLLGVQVAADPGMGEDPRFPPTQEEVGGHRVLRLLAVSPQVEPQGGPTAALTSGTAALRFFPDGTARLEDQAPHPGVTLFLDDDTQQHPYRITVLGRTGFARLLEGPRP